MEANELRLALLLAGIVFLALLYWFSRPRPDRGRRRGGRLASRREPRLGAAVESAAAAGNGAPLPAPEAGPARPRVLLGPLRACERLVTLYVVAPEDGAFRVSDVVVACEKLGLIYGEGGIFHRLADGDRQGSPLFSVASMVEPGSFDLSAAEPVEIPGLCVFMGIPGVRPALDQWEAMLPVAERLAGLLGGRLLDERRNALGRQAIAHMRDELRAFDRRQGRRRIGPEQGRSR